MRPLAPPRLSITSCCPSNVAIAGVTARASTSGVPPAGTDTMTRTGLSGYADAGWARDDAGAHASSAAQQVRPARVALIKWRRNQAPYLNDKDKRARNCVILPLSTLTSSLFTSAMRRSRSDFDAVLTALRAAASHDSELVPMTSVTR